MISLFHGNVAELRIPTGKKHRQIKLQRQQKVRIWAFVLTSTSCMAVFYENDAFSFLMLSTKKRYSSFLKKVFVFKKICFKVKVLEKFKTSTDCRIKTCRSLKRRASLKISSTIFWKNLCSF